MRINDHGEQTISCAHSDCEMIVDDDIVKRILSDEDVLLKYNRLISDSFVKVNSINTIEKPGPFSLNFCF